MELVVAQREEELRACQTGRAITKSEPARQAIVFSYDDADPILCSLQDQALNHMTSKEGYEIVDSNVISKTVLVPTIADLTTQGYENRRVNFYTFVLAKKQ